MKENYRNETVKREYFGRLRMPGKRSESTIEAIERALRKFELETDFADFRMFDRIKAQKFVKRVRESGMQARAQGVTVKHVRSFFEWLSGQPGYKSKVRLNDIEYLTPDRKTTFEALEEKTVRFPSLEYVLKLANSIECETEIGMRDRALISLFLLSGIRVMAAATLSLGSFNPELFEIRQFPSEGVKTKNSKGIIAYLFRIDQSLIDNLMRWQEYLAKVLLFANTDPLFPCTRVIRNAESGFFEYNGVEPLFWQSDGPIRDMLGQRAEAAGLEYYNPHSYRHLTAHLVLPKASGPEHWQAIKQNFGHKFLATTMDCYGRLTPRRQGEVIANFDFETHSSGEGASADDSELLARLKQAGIRLDILR